VEEKKSAYNLTWWNRNKEIDVRKRQGRKIRSCSEEKEKKKGRCTGAKKGGTRNKNNGKGRDIRGPLPEQKGEKAELGEKVVDSVGGGRR